MEPLPTAAAAAATEEEELIPSLSNDVAVNILARVPRSDHPTLSLVSKTIKSLVSSPLFFTTRTLVSSTQHHIYFSLSSLRSPFSLFFFTLNDHDHNHNHRYSLIRVPPFPSPSPSPEKFAAYVSLGHTIFVLGGSYRNAPTPQVWTLDCRFNKWEAAPPMLVARIFPSAGVIDNKVYVFGGCDLNSDTWAEVFDPVIGKWEAVPSPIEVRDMSMYSSAVVDDKLYFMANRGGIVYDPKNKVWGRAGQDIGWTGRGCVVGGILYCFDFLGKIRGFDVKEKVWKEVEGLDTGLPKFLCRVNMANVGEKLVVMWEESVNWNMGRNRKREMEIWCAVIGLEKKSDNGELRGNIGWVDKVRTMPNGSSMMHCLAVSV